MSPETPLCRDVAAALAAGPLLPGPLADHLAACPRCQATGSLVAALAASSEARIPAASAASSLPPSTLPTLAGLRRATRVRAARRVALGGALAAVVLLAWLRLPAAPADPLAADPLAADPLAADPLARAAPAPGAPLGSPDPAARGAPDLLAVLDDAARVVTPADPLPGEDLLALVDPDAEDPLGAADPFVDALLGEGSL